jgi:hypothetical protein
MTKLEFTRQLWIPLRAQQNSFTTTVILAIYHIVDDNLSFRTGERKITVKEFRLYGEQGCRSNGRASKPPEAKEPI